MASTDTAPLVVGSRLIDRTRLAEVCRRFGVSELSLFGSMARHEGGADSDVDLLFVLAPDVRLGFAVSRLEAELVAIFGRPVDLLAKDSIHRLIREEVLSSARVVYAA
jgi:uncharacterized protein